MKNIPVFTLAILSTCLFISGCATQTTTLMSNQSVQSMQLGIVSVNLKQKYVNPKFYSQNDIANKLEVCLEKALLTKDKYNANSDSVLNVNLDYKRGYVGEAFGMKNAVSRPNLGYQYSIVRNGQVIQVNSEKNLDYNNGLMGNLKTVMTMDLDQTNKEAEDPYIQAICDTIVNKIS